MPGRLMHERADCVSFLSRPHSVHPAQCFLLNGSLVKVCALNENGRSHPMIRKNHQGIKREAKGHGNPACNKARKNQT